MKKPRGTEPEKTLEERGVLALEAIAAQLLELNKGRMMMGIMTKPAILPPGLLKPGGLPHGFGKG